MKLKEKIDDAVVPKSFHVKLTRIAELLDISKGELIQDLSRPIMYQYWLPIQKHDEEFPDKVLSEEQEPEILYSLKQQLLRIYKSRRKNAKDIDLMEKKFKNKYPFDYFKTDSERYQKFVKFTGLSDEPFLIEPIPSSKPSTKSKKLSNTSIEQIKVENPKTQLKSKPKRNIISVRKVFKFFVQSFLFILVVLLPNFFFLYMFEEIYDMDYLSILRYYPTFFFILNFLMVGISIFSGSGCIWVIKKSSKQEEEFSFRHRAVALIT